MVKYIFLVVELTRRLYCNILTSWKFRIIGSDAQDDGSFSTENLIARQQRYQFLQLGKDNEGSKAPTT